MEQLLRTPTSCMFGSGIMGVSSLADSNVDNLYFKALGHSNSEELIAFTSLLSLFLQLGSIISIFLIICFFF